MQRATIKLLLALALIVSSVGGVTSIAMASDHEHLGDYQVVNKQFFPFVPNGAMIGDTGPWHGTITVQNFESEPVHVWILEDGRFEPDQALDEFQLYSQDSRSIALEELEPEWSEGSLVVMAMYDEIWNTRHNETGLQTREILGEMDIPKIGATLKQTAGAPMHEDIWTGGAQEILDGYSAIPMNDVGWGALSVNCPSANLNSCGNIEGLSGVDGTSYLPLAQSNNNWNTIVYVTNVDGALDGDSTVDVDLIPTGESDNDSEWSQQGQLGPGETWAIDVTEAVGSGWIGSVRIESDAGMAAVAARHKPSTDMLLMNTSAPSRSDGASTGYRLNAPLIFSDWGGWNTGFSMSNQSSQTNEVVVRFYDQDGDEAGEASTTIAGNGHGYIYLPSEVDPGQEGWYGTAVVESANARPFHAAVDQVNYNNGAAMSYTLGERGANHTLGNEVLGLPLLQKTSDNGQGDTSGIQLFNPDPENSVQATISLYASNGSPINLPGGVAQVDLGPRESYTFYAPDIPEIPDNTHGSVVVTVTGGSGQVVAVSNLVNYDIQGDGAAAFSLTNGFGQFR